MPPLTTVTRRAWGPARSTAVLAVAALVLSACGGDSSEDRVEETPTGTPTPSESAEVPDGVTVTEPGTRLSFGEQATVVHNAGDTEAVLGLSADSAKQGSLDDLRGFELDTPLKRRGNYYYVQVTVRNEGEKRVGGIPVPLWGISGDNTLLQPLIFRSAFEKCQTEVLPKALAPGKKFKTCLVFLSPNHGSLEGVSYRPTDEFDPIEWRGKVKMLPEPKKKGDDKKGDRRQEG